MRRGGRRDMRIKVMKNSIAQHQQHLQNMLVCLKEEWQNFLRADRHVRASKLRVDLLRDQLEKAIQDGRDGFDDDRFMKNRVEGVAQRILKIHKGDEDPIRCLPY